MKSIEVLREQLVKLLEEGSTLLDELQKSDMALGDLAPRYEKWYTKALAAVAQVIPERLPEFRDAYRNEKRKEITYASYTISDFLRGLRITRSGAPVFNTTSAAATQMLRQLGIVGGALEIAPSVLKDIRATLRAELLDSDLGAARDLLRTGHLRSAGIVAGVVIEAHLGAVCERLSIALRKKAPTISDFNEALKAAGAYDVPTWRLIQRLADIRNICGHKKGRDPKPDEVEDLISGAEKISKEVF